MKLAESRSGIGLPVVILVALFVPPLLSESVITFLTATPLRQAVSVVFAALILLGVCYLAVPRMSVHGSAATEGGDT